MTAPEYRSPEWVEERKTYLGGTDIPRILGVSRFGGPMDVFMEKRGLTAPLVETERMKWGNILEEPVAREYAARTGRRVVRHKGVIRDEAVPYFAVNIDRWSDGPPGRRVLEVKTADVFSSQDFGEPGSSEVPPDYYLQVMWQLFVTNKDVADVAALIGGNRLWLGTIERDRELIEKIVDVAHPFWEDTQAGIPPVIDGSEASDQYLRLTYHDDGSEIPLTEELDLLARDHEALRLRIKEDSAARDLIGNRIRELMGNARMALGEGVKITNAEVKGRTTIQWERLVDDLHPFDAADIIGRYTVIGEPGRQLRVTIKE